MTGIQIGAGLIAFAVIFYGGVSLAAVVIVMRQWREHGKDD